MSWRYLAPRKDNLPWLWRLTRFVVNYLVNRTAEAAGFTNLHPHCLRHSGYALAGRGVDLRTIQEWARAPFDCDDGEIYKDISAPVQRNLEGLIRTDVSQEASQHSVN
jgi:hypothetical protein